MRFRDVRSRVIDSSAPSPARWQRARRRHLETALALAPLLFAAGCSDDPVAPPGEDGASEPTLVLVDTFGGERSTLWSVSSNGTVAVGYADDATGSFRALRWTEASGGESLGVLRGGWSSAFGVSPDGSVIVGDAEDAAPRWSTSIRWSAGQGLAELGILDGPWSAAFAASNGGEVVVGQSSTDGGSASTAFRWTAGAGLESLGTLGQGSLATDVSANGSVIVGSAWAADQVERPVRWTGGQGLVELPLPHGGWGRVEAVSSGGEVAVGRVHDAQGRYRAARWPGVAAPAILGILDPGGEAEALGISDDGRTVVGVSRTAAGASRAVRWDARGGVEDLNLTFAVVLPAGWILATARDVSGDGTVIVGEAESTSGTAIRGFILHTGDR